MKLKLVLGGIGSSIEIQLSPRRSSSQRLEVLLLYFILQGTISFFTWTYLSGLSTLLPPCQIGPNLICFLGTMEGENVHCIISYRIHTSPRYYAFLISVGDFVLVLSTLCNVHA